MGGPVHGTSNELLLLRCLVPVRIGGKRKLAACHLTCPFSTRLRDEGGGVVDVALCPARRSPCPGGACRYTVVLWSGLVHMLSGLADSRRDLDCYIICLVGRCRRIVQSSHRDAVLGVLGSACRPRRARYLRFLSICLSICLNCIATRVSTYCSRSRIGRGRRSRMDG